MFLFSGFKISHFDGALTVLFYEWLIDSNFLIYCVKYIFHENLLKTVANINTINSEATQKFYSFVNCIELFQIFPFSAFPFLWICNVLNENWLSWEVTDWSSNSKVDGRICTGEAILLLTSVFKFETIGSNLIKLWPLSFFGQQAQGKKEKTVNEKYIIWYWFFQFVYFSNQVRIFKR